MEVWVILTHFQAIKNFLKKLDSLSWIVKVPQLHAKHKTNLMSQSQEKMLPQFGPFLGKIFPKKFGSVKEILRKML